MAQPHVVLIALGGATVAIGLDVLHAGGRITLDLAGVILLAHG